MNNISKSDDKIKNKKFDFDLFLEQVSAYVQEHGGYNNITIDPIIGQKVKKVRESYKGKRHSIRLTPEMIEMLNEIGFVWNTRNLNWFEDFYNKLVEYKKEHGSFYAVTQDKEIGSIVGSIRQAYKNPAQKKLTQEMIDELNRIGFPWESETRLWFNAFFEKVKAYKEKYNGFDGITTDPEIGVKVRTVRSAYNGRGTTRLTQDMIDKLDSIDFSWGTTKKEWLNTFVEKVKAYKEANGSFYAITRDYDLCSQVARVRQAYKGKINLVLPQWFIDQLNEIGFAWEAEQKDWFGEFYQNLIKYKKLRGSFKGVATDPLIGYTVGSVRQSYKGNRKQILTPEMIEKLEEIGFPWDAGYGKLVKKTSERVRKRKAFDFEFFFNELVKFKQENGHLNVPVTYSLEITNEDGIKVNYCLGTRVASIRTGRNKFNQGLKASSYALTENQYKRLDDLGFIWKLEHDYFTQFYNELNEFKAKFNTLIIPVKYINPQTGYALGKVSNAVRCARRDRENGNISNTSYKLTEEQIKMLDDIGYVWEKYSTIKEL